MEAVEIRPATPQDIDAVVALERAAFPSPWRREFFEGELQQGGRLNLVALRGGTLIGYLFAMSIFDEMHVNKIAVAQRERRQGIALELMERCFAFARQNAIATISLEVRVSNEGAQAFYRKLGFARSHTRARYYPDGEAAAIMTMRISH